METTKPLFDLATVRCPHVLLTASLFDIVDIYAVHRAGRLCGRVLSPPSSRLPSRGKCSMI